MRKTSSRLVSSGERNARKEKVSKLVDLQELTVKVEQAVVELYIAPSFHNRADIHRRISQENSDVPPNAQSK